MDFLESLKDAVSKGVTKEEYVNKWKMEQGLMQGSNETQSNTHEDVIPGDRKNDDCTENGTDRKNDDYTENGTVMSLLGQIAEQQNKLFLQQDSIQQQLKDLQSSHKKEQKKIQQHFEMMHDTLAFKVSALETTVANLHQSFAQSVRQYVQSESLDVQEKLFLMTESNYNHILNEIRNLSRERTSVSKTHVRGEKRAMMQAHTMSQISKENGVNASSSGCHDTASADGGNDIITDHSDNDCGDEENEKLRLPHTGVEEDGVENVPSLSDTEISRSLRHILCYELNAFLVSVQKLLLRPLNSEDVSFYITDRMKELLQYERNITTDQLYSVQTAISSDIHARFCKIEMCFKQELERTRCSSEHKNNIMLEVNKTLEEFNMLKNFIYAELPTRITSLLKLTSLSEVDSVVDLGDTKQSRLRDSNFIKHGGRQKLTKSCQAEREMIFASNCGAEGNDQDCRNEQIQTMMLTLMMYVLMLLTYNDTMSNEHILATQPTTATHELQLNSALCSDLWLEPKTTPAEPPKEKSGTEHTFGPQLTDAHFKLMFGQKHKESNYLCELQFKKPLEKQFVFSLTGIAPGYNLQLKAEILQSNGPLNFHIMSVSGEKDDILNWPAEFIITIMLVNEKPLPCSKQDNYQSFTKTKILFKPIKSTGQSKPTPFCFFREDVINRSAYEESLVFKVSARYTGVGKDKMQD